MYLLTQEPKNIELSALLVKAGVSASRMDEIGEKLSRIDPRSVKVWEDSIDGKIYRIVSYKYSCSILMLLAAAYACSVSQNAANSLNLVRKSPIL